MSPNRPRFGMASYEAWKRTTIRWRIGDWTYRNQQRSLGDAGKLAEIQMAKKYLNLSDTLVEKIMIPVFIAFRIGSERLRARRSWNLLASTCGVDGKALRILRIQTPHRLPERGRISIGRFHIVFGYLRRLSHQRRNALHRGFASFQDSSLPPTRWRRSIFLTRGGAWKYAAFPGGAFFTHSPVCGVTIGFGLDGYVLQQRSPGEFDRTNLSRRAFALAVKADLGL